MPNADEMLVKLQTKELTTDQKLHEAAEKFLTYKAKADALEVKDDDSAKEAAETASILAKMEKWFTEQRQERTKPLKDRAKLIESDFALFLDPIKEMRESVNKKIKGYLLILEDRAKKAAEAKRQAEEQRRKEAEERRKAELAVAEAVGAPPPAVPLPLDLLEDEPAPVEAPKSITGVLGSAGTRKVWTAKVDDLMLLVKAVAEGKAPIEALEANESFLKKTAQLHKRDLGWPGVTMCEDMSIVNK